MKSATNVPDQVYLPLTVINKKEKEQIMILSHFPIIHCLLISEDETDPVGQFLRFLWIHPK